MTVMWMVYMLMSRGGCGRGHKGWGSETPPTNLYEHRCTQTHNLNTPTTTAVGTQSILVKVHIPM